MELIVYKNIPCPVLSTKEPDTFLILFKGEQKWIFECSLGYGEIASDKDGIFYYFNRKLHRESGPACEYSTGDKIWYKEGEFHRSNGPAIEYYRGTKCWYKNGNSHRLDGPAVEYYDGSKSWYIEGKKYFEEDYLEKIEEMKRNGTYSL